ncbi:MAG: ATP-binding protein [Gammaproteobacteria bacterium]
MVRLSDVFSSIIVRVMGLTVGGIILLFLLLIALMQTPFTNLVFPSVVEENAVSIAELVWLLENVPEEMEPFILSAYSGSERLASVSDSFENGLQLRAELRAELDSADSDVTGRLRNREIRFRNLGALELRRDADFGSNEALDAASAIHIAIELEDGRVLNLKLAPSASLPGQPRGILVAITLLVVFALIFSYSLSSVMLRPVQDLERDAERIGLAEVGTVVSESGPVELRRIASALNRMRSRLANLIREREQIMVAIAHDIRTGLTRVRLRMSEGHTITEKEIESDLNQMESLVTDMLAYARAESPKGPRELIELNTFLAKIAETAPFEVAYSNTRSTDRFEIAGDPIALRRLFENLLDNARSYGNGQISLCTIFDGKNFVVRVEDNGPGLPEDQLEDVFEPFYRQDSSRSRQTGGSGLGLGIARAIARAHGASLELENRPAGGLSAIVSFPEAIRT